MALICNQGNANILGPFSRRLRKCYIFTFVGASMKYSKAVPLLDQTT